MRRILAILGTIISFGIGLYGLYQVAWLYRFVSDTSYRSQYAINTFEISMILAIMGFAAFILLIGKIDQTVKKVKS